MFTGGLRDFTREGAQELVVSLGGNVTSSVSKQTDFVVAGVNPGSKYDKAKKLNVKIIDEEEFAAMTKQKQSHG